MAHLTFQEAIKGKLPWFVELLTGLQPTDPPPLKWSALWYVLERMAESPGKPAERSFRR